VKHTFTWYRDCSTDVGGVRIDWEDECVVTYKVSGKYIRAKINAPMEDCYPAEYPEIEIESIINSRGEDIFEQLVGKEEQQIEESALDRHYEP
jgi:hypothetical protein